MNEKTKKGTLRSLIDAKNNVIAKIQTRLVLNAYYKKALTDEQIVNLQKFFKSCDAALTDLEEPKVKTETVIAITGIVELGEEILKSI